MDSHLKKHFIHAVFLLAITAAVRAGGLALSAVEVVAVVVLTLGSLEAGLWLVRRREEEAPAEPAR